MEKKEMNTFSLLFFYRRESVGFLSFEIEAQMKKDHFFCFFGVVVVGGLIFCLLGS